MPVDFSFPSTIPSQMTAFYMSMYIFACHNPSRSAVSETLRPAQLTLRPVPLRIKMANTHVNIAFECVHCKRQMLKKV